jgi:hypothetical protein
MGRGLIVLALVGVAIVLITHGAALRAENRKLFDKCGSEGVYTVQWDGGTTVSATREDGRTVTR